MRAMGCRNKLWVIPLLLWLVSFSSSLAPPQEEFAESWENVHRYRSRLGIHFDYDMQLLDEETCRYLNEEDCQKMDRSFMEQAKKTRDITQTTHHLKTLVVLIEWKDETKTNLVPKSDLEQLWMGVGRDETLYPSGSVQDYVRTNSYGNVELQPYLVDWQVTNGTEQYYAAGRSGLPQTDSEPQLREAFHYVLDQMEQNNFPFEDFDEDGDLLLDSVMFMHSGYGGEHGGVSCEDQISWEDRIWSHAEGTWREDKWTSARTGIQLGAWAVTSAYRGYCKERIARLGITAHEFLHTMGLPDLYDVEGRYEGGGVAVGGLGAYDIMSNPRGPSNKQAWPSNLGPWCKIDLKWVTPIEITRDGTYVARPSELYPDIYIIREGYDEGEYLLLENRQPTGYDERLWTGGILIYHVDGSNGKIRGNKNRGFPGAPEWPSSGKHYPVALLQADGEYHLERAINNGHAEDFFNLRSQRLGPGNGESVATDDGTYPNTDSYASVIRRTGIVIDDFHEVNESGFWSFRVSFPAKTDPPTASPTQTCDHWFQLDLKTDGLPQENTWELIDSKGHEIISGGDNDEYERNRLYQIRKCLLPGETYTLIVFDNYGDGMCCRYGDGGWTAYLDDVEVGSGGEFQFSQSITFSTSQSTPMPSESPEEAPFESPEEAPSESPEATIAHSDSPSSVPSGNQNMPAEVPSSRRSESPSLQPDSSGGIGVRDLGNLISFLATFELLLLIF